MKFKFLFFLFLLNSYPFFGQLPIKNLVEINLNSNIKIIGCGGIKSGVDAYEYILCGANLVQVGTEFEWNP